MAAGDGGDEALSCDAPLNLHASADRKVFTEHNIYSDVTAPRWHSVTTPTTATAVVFVFLLHAEYWRYNRRLMSLTC